MVMDMSFANQALSVEYLRKKGEAQERGLRGAEGIDKEVARLKLKTMGIEIDSMTSEQVRYMSTWSEGT